MDSSVFSKSIFKINVATIHDRTGEQSFSGKEQVDLGKK